MISRWWYILWVVCIAVAIAEGVWYVRSGYWPFVLYPLLIVTYFGYVIFLQASINRRRERHESR